ncbi:MAG: SIMPL domain-containing protein [Bacillota bacterium]
MNRGTGMFLVFIALILLTAVIVNGLYFDNSVFTRLQGDQSSSAELKETEDLLTVNLNINEEKEFNPEMVDVFLGVESRNPDLEAAVSENNEKMSLLLEMLENENLIRIETEDYRVYPVNSYSDEDGEREYQVVNRISFTSEKLEELPLILSKALQQGANQLSQINYQLKNEETAVDEVTALALNKLNKKAEFLQKQLNKQEYKIKNINFGGQNIYRAEKSLSMNSTPRGEATPVPIKEEKVKISVSLSAEIYFK